ARPTLRPVLATTVRGAAARFGERAAVLAPDGRLTYAELEDRSRAAAAGLRSAGVRPGDLVALVLPSGGDWAVAAVAVDRVGGVVAGVSPRLAAPERAGLVDVLRPRLVLADPALVDGLPLRTAVVTVAAGGRCAELADGNDDAPDPDEPDDVLDDPDRPTLVCCTSGTTGRPKGALFRVGQLQAVARIDLGDDALDRWDGGSPMLASTEFAHVGMVGKFPWYFRLGATLVVMERWRPDEALRLVAEHRMPVLGVVAPQLALMLRSPLADELDLSCVQTVIAGGAPSPPALVKDAVARLGCHYSIRYSSTESGGVGLATPADADERQATRTVGRPRPGVEARVVDEDGRELGPDEVGELQLRSPATMVGYWNDPDATSATLTPDGWLRTGDLATVDPTGCVTLAGRRTEMYIRGGYNVFPAEVEAVLGEHPLVAAVAVATRPDDVLGETGVAVVVPADPAAPPTLEGLREYAGQALARHKLPDDLVLVDELPLTAGTKLDRRALQTVVEESLQQQVLPADGSA
ncbi:MAG: class I adenylate-forming enzyme family protein, partial [Actinomycetes bacterium]